MITTKIAEGYPRYTVTIDGVVYDTLSKRIMKQPLAGYGLKYPRVCILNEEGVRKSVYVHRLVANAFIPKIEGKDLVNHKDGNKLNNHYSNLEWCTVKENNDHAYKNGLVRYDHLKNKKFPFACVNSKPVLQLTKEGVFIQEFNSITEAERSLGLKQSKIRHVANKYRNYSTSAGYKWEFKESQSFIVP